MLARLVLIALQFAIGIYAAPHIQKFIPRLGDPVDLFVLAAIFAVVIWLVGLIGALVLKDVSQPTPSALVVTLVFACIFAALTLVPDVMTAINSVIKVPTEVYSLIGAVIGYALKR